MLENTKWAHFTVPHSGTRYVNEAVQAATGHKAWQCASLQAIKRLRDRNDPRTSEDFIFCHIGQRWDDFIDQVVSEEHIKTWVTVREPINTWGTHWGHLHRHQNANGDIDFQAQYEKLGQLRGQYATLQSVLPKVGYVHRIEDGLSGLSEYLGLDLKEHERTFSQSTPMKKALWERDIETIERLTEGHDFWRAFRDHITPDYKDFWESLGYDIWWYNG